ncbi:hypothetical protein P3G55_17640 [Leptospira sp. 96542]|nr:hypothetical protein [Leptospira sp. 96542]
MGNKKILETETSSVDISIVLGFIATKDLNTTEKKVSVLSQLGYNNQQMAIICGTSAGVIKSVKSLMKKKS